MSKQKEKMFVVVITGTDFPSERDLIMCINSHFEKYSYKPTTKVKVNEVKSISEKIFGMFRRK